MPLAKADIEQRRSPKDLRRFVLTVMETVSADRDERHRGILKKELYKQFLEEIVPLSCFAVLADYDDVEVQPVLGIQGYDALVFDASGKVCDRIEITSPCDGAREAVDARDVVEHGCGAVRIGDPCDDFDELRPHLLKTCQSKAVKDYSDCTLVISVTVQPPFAGFESLWEEKLSGLAEDLGGIHFKAKRVFLLLPWPDRIVPIMRHSRSTAGLDRCADKPGRPG